MGPTVSSRRSRSINCVRQGWYIHPVLVHPSTRRVLVVYPSTINNGTSIRLGMPTHKSRIVYPFLLWIHLMIRRALHGTIGASRMYPRVNIPPTGMSGTTDVHSRGSRSPIVHTLARQVPSGWISDQVHPRAKLQPACNRHYRCFAECISDTGAAPLIYAI